jgi:hypothetical protein
MSSDVPVMDGTWIVALNHNGEPEWVEITSFL